ncbi:type IX secretion system membrane protein PorP/SprF [Pedobacter sp. BS3]|uniref:PorP/SprF family type IX secretion system membrane protein n=1 Tax=Pedobacter sp. BS3 TaxID=2567937 RepID=UPI0011F053F9|nr:type IX secretion system membrane protein PorP/SprF [Pedobacter sp. BS3]TZF84753.1 type IX secretion system membrane protein PorP/SprF [Pedobacter sp. BS3]
MKKVFLFWMLSVCITQSYAQQLPQYTQYIFNNYLLNPALSGIENYIDVKLGYRKQWQGLEGAPETSYISLNMPIGKNFTGGDANGFPEKGDNPNNRSFVRDYMAAEPHHGIGINAVVDKAGPLQRTDVNLTYAYHLGLSSRVNLAAGIAAGVSRVSLDISKVSLENKSDPAIVSGQDNDLQPNLSAGLWLYGPAFFAGVSAQQLLGRQISFTNDNKYDEGKQVMHVFATAGYKFFLGENITATPSVMFKYISPAPTSVDMNLKLAFQDKFWLGGGYRNKDSFSAMAGFNVSYLFNLSYSYDFTTSQLNTVSNGTHEIVLGLLLNNRYRVTCPQRQF